MEDTSCAPPGTELSFEVYKGKFPPPKKKKNDDAHTQNDNRKQTLDSIATVATGLKRTVICSFVTFKKYP